MVHLVFSIHVERNVNITSLEFNLFWNLDIWRKLSFLFLLIISNMPKAFSLFAKNGHSDGSSYLSSSLCPFTNGYIQWFCCVDLNHSTRTFTFCVLFLGAFVLQKQLFWYKLERDVVHCSEKLGLANLLFLWHDPTWFFLDWMASLAI